MDDHQIGAMSRKMQIKLGSYLVNLMTKNLKYKIGNKEFLLLKAHKIRG